MKSGINHIPAVVRDMDDDMAVIALVDGNLHRENLLPSEKARALPDEDGRTGSNAKTHKRNIGLIVNPESV